MKHVQFISVVVPTLDEVENIDLLLSSVLSQSTASMVLEILVADGGSTDGTIERVLEWEAKAPVRLVLGDGRRGLAGDVLTAGRCAASNIIVLIDAYMSHPPEQIRQVAGLPPHYSAIGCYRA